MTMEQDRIDTLARRLILLQAMEQRVGQAKAAAKDELHQLIRPGTTLRPALSDGDPAGYVSYPSGGVRASVADPDAFADWVQRVYPTECRLTVQVRDAFRDKVLEMSQLAGVPIGPGGETGESAPAGIRVREHAGALRAVPDRDRLEALWTEIRSGATAIEELGQ